MNLYKEYNILDVSSPSLPFVVLLLPLLYIVTSTNGTDRGRMQTLHRHAAY